jgi:Pre-toxin TG
VSGFRLAPRWRRRLRILQLAAGVWTTWTLVHLVLAQSAAADNCSVFTDCFGVANSAIEAAFGLSLLAALSLVLDFIPIVGDVKGGVEAVTGRDLVTGEELAPWERALGAIPFLGELGALAGVAKHLDDSGDLARVGRHADDAGDVSDVGRHLGDGSGLAGAGRVAGEVPPARSWPQPGATRDLSPAYDNLIDQYRDTATTAAQRTRISEELGEAGALDYARQVSGEDSLPLFRPQADADVSDLVDRVDSGQAWDRAVAYNGRNATNVMYFDGETLHIVEAKGGGGQYGDRASVAVNPPQRISQTDPDYPRDVAANMSSSSRSDGRNAMGDLIERMYDENNVRYVGIRTGPYGELVGGTPRIEIEHVFLEPPPAP